MSTELSEKRIMAPISIIGAGSAVFAYEIMRDVLITPASTVIFSLSPRLRGRRGRGRGGIFKSLLTGHSR
jgi:hypothetical protein